MSNGGAELNTARLVTEGIKVYTHVVGKRKFRSNLTSEDLYRRPLPGYKPATRLNPDGKMVYFTTEDAFQGWVKRVSSNYN